MLSIYNELNRYCEKNNVWCMLFKWNNGVKKYLLIKKNIFHKTEDFSFILCFPINDFSSEKYFSKEKKLILLIILYKSTKNISLLSKIVEDFLFCF